MTRLLQGAKIVNHRFLGGPHVSDHLNPDFPVVSGDYVLTKGWRVSLPEQFNRRIEDDSLVLWMPDLTLWINIWNNDRKASLDELLHDILARANPERSAEKCVRGDGVIRLSFELAEDDAEPADCAANSINSFIITSAGYAQVSAYADTPDAQALAYRIVNSIATA